MGANLARAASAVGPPEPGAAAEEDAGTAEAEEDVEVTGSSGLTGVASAEDPDEEKTSTSDDAGVGDEGGEISSTGGVYVPVDVADLPAGSSDFAAAFAARARVAAASIAAIS